MGNLNLYVGHIVFSLIVSTHRTKAGSSRPFLTHNSGDRHGLFRFVIPSKFLGAVLGPQTYAWLVGRYGQGNVDRSGIFRAPSDDHTCGTAAWCREECLSAETRDWQRKDLCGVFHCCVLGYRKGP